MISSSSRRETDHYDSLQARINKLEESADLNRDGLVTKEELREYAARELELKDSEILMLRAEKARLEKDLTDLRDAKQVKIEKARQDAARWKQAYEALHIRHEAYLEMVAKDQEQLDGKKSTTVISNQAIDRFVDELLADPNINIYLLPDGIERPLYANTLKIMLSILQKVFNNANIDLIGHEFKVRMQPTLETRLKDDGVPVPDDSDE